MALTNVFSGKDGTLGLAVAGTPVQQGDFNAISDAYGAAFVGRVTDVEVCVRTELEEFFQIGRRDVVRLQPGNVHVTGNIDRAYINGALLFLLLGRGATENELTTVAPKFIMNLTLNDSSVPDNTLKLNVFGVKFESWGLHIPQKDFVMEKVRFKAERMGILDRDAGTDISVAFPALAQPGS